MSKYVGASLKGSISQQEQTLQKLRKRKTAQNNDVARKAKSLRKCADQRRLVLYETDSKVVECRGYTEMPDLAKTVRNLPKSHKTAARTSSIGWCQDITIDPGVVSAQ